MVTQMNDELQTQLQITQKNLSDAEEREEMLLKAIQQYAKTANCLEYDLFISTIESFDWQTAQRIHDFVG